MLTFFRGFSFYQELHDAVSKLNAYFGGDKAQGRLNQDDVASIGLGTLQSLPAEM